MLELLKLRHLEEGSHEIKTQVSEEGFPLTDAGFLELS